MKKEIKLIPGEEPREPVVLWVNEYKSDDGNILYGAPWESAEDCKKNVSETLNYIRTIKLQEIKS